MNIVLGVIILKIPITLFHIAADVEEIGTVAEKTNGRDNRHVENVLNQNQKGHCCTVGSVETNNIGMKDAINVNRVILKTMH